MRNTQMIDNYGPPSWLTEFIFVSVGWIIHIFALFMVAIMAVIRVVICLAIIIGIIYVICLIAEKLLGKKSSA